MSEKKKILIIGLGAVGTMYALIIKSSGLAHVTVVARSNYAVVKEHGLNIKSRKFGDHVGFQPDRLCSSVSEAADTTYDYVLVVTKCVPEVITTSKLLEPFLLPSYAEAFAQPTYVLLQNGLQIERELYDAIKSIGHIPRIISVAVFILTNQSSPNVVEHDQTEKFVCGVYRPDDFTTSANSESELCVLNGLADIIVRGGGVVEVVPEIQRRKFHKNMYNIVFASICLLTRFPLTAIFRAPPTGEEVYEPYAFPATQPLLESHTVALMHSIFKELLDLARSLGFPDSEDGIPASVQDEAIKFTRESHSTPWSFHKPSTLLDCEKDSPMEIEVIWGSVVRLATERKVDIPRVEMAYGLLLVMQNQILRKISSR
ncbi:6-phosphogluconate dehydrogenase C-terminal domain-like protein [Hymenopellis radicata]|nr:6-phosphogluconate dehydrogenase C-terminal domain-like protein [Hymenopellis radicata]